MSSVVGVSKDRAGTIFKMVVFLEVGGSWTSKKTVLLIVTVVGTLSTTAHNKRVVI